MRTFLFLALAALFLLRLDLWQWDDPSLVLGLPVGLTFHASICLAAAVVMFLFTRFAWPEELEAVEDE